MNNSPKLVPFGKYKDQPLEIMLADVQYVEWLTAQPWFTDTNGRYQNIYQTIINYGVSDSKTPEHNKMQVRFLEDKLRTALYNMHLPNGTCVDTTSVLFEIGNWDVIINKYLGVELKPSLGDDYPNVMRQIEQRRNKINMRAASSRVIEADWVPYQAAQKVSVVCCDEFNASSATFDQVRQMLGLSNISLVLFSEIV